MKKILGFLFSILFATSAYAQVSINGLVGLHMTPELAKYFVDNGIALSTLTNNAWLSSANATPAAANIKLVKLDAANNTHVNAITGKVIELDINLTPVADFSATGVDSAINTLVLTAPTAIAIAPGSALTPIAQWQTDGISFTKALAGPIFPAAAVITPVVTYSAGTGVLTQKNNIIAAGAPTSAFLELPAITANVGKNLRIYNQGSNPVAIVPSTGVVNVAGALTPYICSTLSKCDCEGLTTGVWGCTKAAW